MPGLLRSSTSPSTGKHFDCLQNADIGGSSCPSAHFMVPVGSEKAIILDLELTSFVYYVYDLVSGNKI